MRVAFFGSPAFAVPSLRALHERHEVVLVVSQPDKPAGRGLRRRAPAVALEAERLGLELEQPARLRGNLAFEQRLAALRPTVAVSAAYGKILPQSLLDLPSFGFLNVHASLLPAYRGAAPIQWALIHGESETGISIMRTEAGLDTGPVCLVRRCAISEHDTAADLFERLARLGAAALLEALDGLAAGDLECRPQDATRATLAPLLSKEDGRLDFSEPAAALYNRYRGVKLWPGAYFEHGASVVRVERMAPAAGKGAPGEILALSDGVLVATAEGALLLQEVKPAGRARVSAREWANGQRLAVGDVLA